MIAVLGLGFVGLTTALGFADKGFEVAGFDVDEARMSALQDGHVPFFEPHLEDKLKEHAGRKFTLANSLEEVLAQAEVVFLCVGTPQGDDGRADLGYIFAALDQIIANTPADLFRTIVVKSTVPPSSSHLDVRNHLQQAGVSVGKQLGIANNPEFLREGYAWDDFMNPDRIVVGVDDEHSKEVLEKLYAPFGVPFHAVSLNTGEFVKYLSNTLLSTLISYANEMAMIAHSIGDIDIKSAFEILHEDKRWSGSPANMASYAYPGCGFGGYCLPKDTQALATKAAENGMSAKILNAVLQTNVDIRSFVVEKITQQLNGSDNTVGILGLAFKPGSDDVRDSPSLHVIKGLNEKGISNIVAYDPLAKEEFEKAYPDLETAYVSSLEELQEKAGLFVILTGWPEFREKKAALEATAPVLDFRYIL